MAVRAPPTCSLPVGEGAKRTRTPCDTVDVWVLVAAAPWTFVALVKIIPFISKNLGKETLFCKLKESLITFNLSIIAQVRKQALLYLNCPKNYRTYICAPAARRTHARAHTPVHIRALARIRARPHTCANPPFVD